MITTIKQFKKLNESVRRGSFPYFTYYKTTKQLTFDLCNNDLEQDAICFNRKNDDKISFCGSGWSMEYCKKIGNDIKNMYESGTSFEKIMEILEEEY